MKKAEEVLKEKFYMVWTHQDFDSFGPKVCEIMEQFASEQNAQLRKENEELRKRCSQNYGGGFTDEEIKLCAQIDRLTELLRRVQMEAIGYNDYSLSNELLTEIENAIKP